MKGGSNTTDIRYLSPVLTCLVSSLQHFASVDFYKYPTLQFIFIVMGGDSCYRLNPLPRKNSSRKISNDCTVWATRRNSSARWEASPTSLFRSPSSRS